MQAGAGSDRCRLLQSLGRSGYRLVVSAKPETNKLGRTYSATSTAQMPEPQPRSIILGPGGNGYLCSPAKGPFGFLASVISLCRMSRRLSSS